MGCSSSSNVGEASVPFITRAILGDKDSGNKFTVCTWNVLQQELIGNLTRCDPKHLEWEYRFDLMK
jgi:hypothetical protein